MDSSRDPTELGQTLEPDDAKSRKPEYALTVVSQKSWTFLILNPCLGKEGCVNEAKSSFCLFSERLASRAVWTTGDLRGLCRAKTEPESASARIESRIVNLPGGEGVKAPGSDSRGGG